MVWGYHFSCGRMYFALQRTGSLLHIICMLHLPLDTTWFKNWYNMIQLMWELAATHNGDCLNAICQSAAATSDFLGSNFAPHHATSVCSSSIPVRFPKIPCSSEVCWKAFNVPCLLHTELRLHHAPCCAMLRHAPSNAAGKLCSPHDLQATSDTPPGTAWTHREVESR